MSTIDDDVATSIIETSDGGFALAGYSQTTADKDELLIMKGRLMDARKRDD